MNNIQDIINKIPSSLYFTQLPDRQQSLKYINYLYQNVPQSKSISQDALFRAVIAHHLRIVSMKIIEIEILVMIALTTITIEDFTSSSDTLIKKVILENPDKYDLDILYRVLAQIMTKAPKDLKERITGKQKLQIFQLCAKFIKMDTKLLEKFTQYNPSLNTPISMELDTNDYKTLNDKYLRELYNFQQKQPYLNSDSMEYGALASKLAQTSLSTSTIEGKKDDLLKAQYIDNNPDLMLGVKDNTLYYFDSSSGTISEMPLNGANQTPISLSELKTILAGSKINQGEIQSAIDAMHPATTIPTPTPTPTPTGITTGYISMLENMFKGLTTGTTQAQAIINTQANLPDNAPIPPTFLTKLYNIKKANKTNYSFNDDGDVSGNVDYNDYTLLDTVNKKKRTSDKQSSTDMEYNNTNTSNTNDDISLINKYSENNASEYNSDLEYNPDIPNRQYNNRNDQYLIWGIEHTKLTNPKTTYKAFSAPSKRTKQIIGSSTNPTYADGTRMSNNAVNADRRYKLLQQSYAQAKPTSTTTTANATVPATTRATTTVPATTTGTISHFNNMNNDVVSKIKNSNKDVENIALGFVSIIVLIFLLVIFNTIRNTNTNTK